MSKITSLMAVALLLASSTGCGVCRNLLPSRQHTVAMPVAAPACQPCQPCCPPPCDPCMPGYGAHGAMYGGFEG